ALYLHTFQCPQAKKKNHGGADGVFFSFHTEWDDPRAAGGGGGGGASATRRNIVRRQAVQTLQCSTARFSGTRFHVLFDKSARLESSAAIGCLIAAPNDNPQTLATVQVVQ